MAKYLVLIYGDEQTWADASPEWQQENMDRHRSFNANNGAAILDGNELEPTTKAVTVRLRGGDRPTATDGPFIESKEVVGGYYFIEAADMGAAIELASQIPEASAPSSGVEIRAIVE